MVKPHSDYYDVLAVEKYVLPKVIKDYKQAFVPNDKYSRADLIYYTENKENNEINTSVVQIKNRLDYDLSKLKTLYIDYETYLTYKDKKDSYIINIFPKNERIVIYDNRLFNSTFVGKKVIDNVKSFSQKNNSWYQQQKKELAEFTLQGVTRYSFNDFNIPQEIIYKLKEDINENK